MIMVASTKMVALLAKVSWVRVIMGEGDYAVDEFSVQQLIMHFLGHVFHQQNCLNLEICLLLEWCVCQCLMREQQSQTLVIT